MKRIRFIRRAIIVLMLIIIGLYSFKHYDNKSYSKNNLNEYISRICEIDGVKGLSIAVMDGEDEYFLNYGNDAKNPVNENTLFELGSTTKAFTALGILNLETEGKLKLSDNVSLYLPWFLPTYKGDTADITIEQLLCHTSGIPVWTISTIPAGEDSDEGLLTQTVQNIKQVKLNHLPGTYHEYATINYDILALIMEEVTGEKYESYIENHILVPLGMNHSFFRTKDEDSQKIIQGYKTSFGASLAYAAPTYYGNTAAGYLVSSASDLVKWMRLWSNRSDKKSALVEAVLKQDVSKTDNYYAGWNIYKHYICHGGNNPNYSSQVIISRHREFGVFVLSNLSGSSASTIADGVYKILTGERVEIGMRIDNNSLLDLVSCLSILLMIYLVLLNCSLHTRRFRWFQMGFGITCIAVLIAIPFVAHYSYQTMWVWCSNSLMVAIITLFTLSLVNVLRGISKNLEK